MTTKQLVKSMSRLCMKLSESVYCREPYNRILRMVGGWKGKRLVATDGCVILFVEHANDLPDFGKDVAEFIGPHPDQKPVDRAALAAFCGEPRWSVKIRRDDHLASEAKHTVVVNGRPMNRLLIARLLTVAPPGPVRIGRNSAMRALTFTGEGWTAIVMEIECRIIGSNEEFIKAEWPRFEGGA